MPIIDAAGNVLTVGFTGQVYTVSAVADSGMYRAQYPVTLAANTSGGRGGTIYRIRSLADNLTAPTTLGDGTKVCSLRRVCQVETGARIVIFEVSGYINNNDDPIQIIDPNITIAGQTAPSPGICLQNEGMQCLTSDVVIQHLAIRPGNWSGTPLIPQTARRDAFITYSILAPSFNVVLDHVSLTWAPGKNLLTAGNPFGDVLLWRSINAEALFRASNVIVSSGQPSSLGMLTGNCPGIDVLQSLFAHNSDRNPEIQEAGIVNFINNIIYAWGYDLTPYTVASFLFSDGAGATLANLINNKYIAGPPPFPFDPLYVAGTWDVAVGSELYITGTTKDTTQYPITDFFLGSGLDPRVGSPATPIPTGYSALTSSTMQTSLLANVGARPLDRSSIDTRIINNTNNYTGSMISSQDAVGGYPTMAVNTRFLTIPSNPLGVSPLRGAPFNEMDDFLEGYARDLEPQQ